MNRKFLLDEKAVKMIRQTYNGHYGQVQSFARMYRCSPNHIRRTLRNELYRDPRYEPIERRTLDVELARRLRGCGLSLDEIASELWTSDLRYGRYNRETVAYHLRKHNPNVEVDRDG